MEIGDAFGYLRLVQSGRLAGGALERRQVRRLRAVLQHASRNAPYWESILKSSGVRAESVDSLTDLYRLPVTRRADLQVAQGHHANDIPDSACVHRRTGGSTGTPLTVRTSHEELALEGLGWLRTWRRLGLRPRDAQAVIEAPERMPPEGRHRWLRKLGFLRVDHLDLFAPAERLVNELTRLAPDVLRAPPSSLLAVANEIDARDAPSPVRPRLAFSTGERLSPDVRNRIGMVLGAPVHDCYGATEAGCIAWRDPANGRYRVNADLVIVEILENGRPVEPGQSGEVVVTNLGARAMPIIRYALGDRAVRSTADPGQVGVHVLEGLLGRTVDQIDLSDGRTVSPYYFMPDSIAGIAHYHVQQVEPGDVCLLVVAGEGFVEAELARACERHEHDLDGACRVTYRLLDSLPTASREGSRVVRAETPTGSSAPPGYAE